MNSNKIGQIILLSGGAITTYLLLLHIFAPAKSKSRLQQDRDADYGLRQEYPRDEAKESTPLRNLRATTDVVFGHGLGANLKETWVYGKLEDPGHICWITDLLPADLRAKGLQSSVRLFTFNYDSFWVQNANSERLSATALFLRQQLTRGEVRDHDVVLVGHSYGGIVIKQALVDLPELKTRVKGVLFLGSPHRGTAFTLFGIFAASILTPLDSDINILRPLVSDSVELHDLDRKFRESFKNTSLLYYYETQKMRRYLLGFIPLVQEFIVSEQSATAGADSSQIFELNTDHRGMNKFKDRNNNYQQALTNCSISSKRIQVIY